MDVFISVRQLHREFLRAGADVMQTFTFYASEDKLSNRGNTASETIGVNNRTGFRQTFMTVWAAVLENKQIKLTTEKSGDK